MAFDAVRGYVQLATGLGDLTRARATQAAQGMLSLSGSAAGGGKAGQVKAVADELLAAAATNREHLLTLMRSEIDAAVLRLGLARASELAAAEERISVLRSQVAELRATAAFAAAEEARGPARTTAPSAGSTRPKRSAIKKSAARSTSTSTTKSAGTGSASTRPAKRSPGTKAATQPAPRKAPTKSAAKKSTATKSTATKSTATKSTAKKSTAPKSAAPKSAGTRSSTKSASTPAKRAARKRG